MSAPPPLRSSSSAQLSRLSEGRGAADGRTGRLRRLRRQAGRASQVAGVKVRNPFQYGQTTNSPRQHAIPRQTTTPKSTIKSQFFIFPSFVFFEKSLQVGSKSSPSDEKSLRSVMDQIENSPAGLPPRSGFFKSPVPDATYLIFPTPPPPAITRTSSDKLATPPILEVGRESRVQCEAHSLDIARSPRIYDRPRFD